MYRITKEKTLLMKNSGERTYINTSNEVVLHRTFTGTMPIDKHNWKDFFSKFMSNEIRKTWIYLPIEKHEIFKTLHAVEKIVFYKLPANVNNIYAAKHTYLLTVWKLCWRQLWSPRHVGKGNIYGFSKGGTVETWVGLIWLNIVTSGIYLRML